MSLLDLQQITSPLLMGAGPSVPFPSVMNVLHKPVIPHYGDQFCALFAEICRLMRTFFGVSNKYTFPIQGPGSLAMEIALANLIEPGDKVLICNNGMYGQRFLDISRCYGAHIIEVVDDWGHSVDMQKVQDTLNKNPDIKVSCFVHAESSTGALSDIEAFSQVTRNHNTFTIVDVVGSAGGIHIPLNDLGLDYVYINPQKFLHSVPGLSPVSLSDRAAHYILQRQVPVSGWFVDLKYILSRITNGDQIHRYYPHTSPVSIFYALFVALDEIAQIGMENYIRTNMTLDAALTEQCSTLNLERMPLATPRIPNIAVLKLPPHIQAFDVQKYLLDHHNIYISTGLGKFEHNTIRIGSIGTPRTDYIKQTVDAVRSYLSEAL